MSIMESWFHLWAHFVQYIAHNQHFPSLDLGMPRSEGDAPFCCDTQNLCLLHLVTFHTVQKGPQRGTKARFIDFLNLPRHARPMGRPKVPRPRRCCADHLTVRWSRRDSALISVALSRTESVPCFSHSRP